MEGGVFMRSKIRDALSDPSFIQVSVVTLYFAFGVICGYFISVLEL